MENHLEPITSQLEKITFRNGNFNIVPQALPERHKDFWKLFVSKWEEENRNALADFIDDETVVVDLGAWVGPLTLLSATLGAKHVYAYEPDPTAYAFLEKNCDANPQLKNKINIADKAIGKNDGEIYMGPLSGRSLGDSTTSTEGTNLIPVPSISVETMRTECHLDQANKICIKIDIEGSEKYVLPNIAKMLADINKPFLLIIEIHSYHFNKEDSEVVEGAIDDLTAISDKVIFKQRRREGEPIQYPDKETEWRSELYHPHGLFDITFLREQKK